jgi:ATP/maltotriose-dependent transcriptional regulator MalT
MGRARALLTSPARGRWEDTVALTDAVLLQHAGQLAAAEASFEELMGSGLAEERPLLVHHASICLADLLLDQGRTAEAGAVLHRAEQLLPDQPNLLHATRLRARRARLHRLDGQLEAAAEVLRETAKGIDPDELTPGHIVWLVESALLAGTDRERRHWIARLHALSEKTGVQVPPWERRWLDAEMDDEMVR